MRPGFWTEHGACSVNPLFLSFSTYISVSELVFVSIRSRPTLRGGKVGRKNGTGDCQKRPFHTCRSSASSLGAGIDQASLDNGSFFEFLIEIHSVIARVYYVIDPNLTAQEAAARNGLANDVVDLRIVRQKSHS